MERIVNIHIERLPEGVYLATSKDVQGLVVQGRTVSETLEIARDAARKLIEAKQEREGILSIQEISNDFDYPLVLGM
jgi:predicted RNase H-like HicB family nuclease